MSESIGITGDRLDESRLLSVVKQVANLACLAFHDCTQDPRVKCEPNNTSNLQKMQNAAGEFFTPSGERAGEKGGNVARGL